MGRTKLQIFPRSLSIRARLLLFVMPIMTVGLLSLSFGAYWYIKNVIEDELSKSMLASVGKSAESINRWLATIMIEPETIAATPAAKAINVDFSKIDTQNINRHKILHEKHPEIFQDIYAANREGEYHTVLQSDDGFEIFVGDIRNRPYFKSIMAGGPTQITPPLISRTTGIPTIFIVSPIQDEFGQPQGLIGAGISLGYIQKIAEELKAGQTGYGFILGRDGTYIFHPDQTLSMQNSITSLEDPSIEALGERMISGAAGLFRYSFKGRPMVAFYQPVPISGWSVATVLPESELFAPATRMIRLLSVITFIFIVLVGIAILLGLESITRPLQTLAGRAQEISAGNLDFQPLRTDTEDELGELSLAFNIMTANLKTTMQGLRQSEDNYRGIFENSLLGIIQSTLEGQVLNANPAMVRMLGYQSLEAMKTGLTDIRNQLYVDPEDRDKIISLLLKHGKVFGREVQFYQCDKTTVWVTMNIALIRDQAGEPVRVESLVTDISSRRQVEHEREVLQGQLVQAQKLEAVGKLAGGVAHDFNNMLSVIIGKTELAMMQLEDSEPLYGTFSDIRKAADHSANLTRQLLTFARKQTVAPQVIDLNRVLREMLSMIRRIIGEDIELVQLRSTDLWPVKIDPDQAGQVLANLCVNARDAIDEIGKIVIETKNVSLDQTFYARFPAHQTGDYVCLTVSDDGCGIEKDALDHIFEPFFTTKGMKKGTGLGLATVYGIVQQNGGMIDTRSEVGQGTTFTLYFPRYRGETHQRSQAKPGRGIATDIATGQETVLLVEDESDLLQMSREMLERLGYTVLPFDNPEQAIEIAQSYAEPIHLLLTDVVMPRMNGRDLASRISAVRPELKCLFMSGYTADIITNQGVLEENVHFLQKPFTIQDLAAGIRESLDGTKNSTAESA